MSTTVAPTQAEKELLELSESLVEGSEKYAQLVKSAVEQEQENRAKKIELQQKMQAFIGGEATPAATPVKSSKPRRGRKPKAKTTTKAKSF